MPRRRKFEGVDFAESDVELLTFDLDIPGTGFRCSRREFVTYWKQGRVKRECDSSVCHCWLIREESGLAAYITLLADKLEVDSPLLKSEDIKYRTFPAVKIGLLAADERAKGAGTRLVEWALEYIAADLSQKIGVRFVTVDALYDPDNGYDTSGYYRRFGFLLADPHGPVPPPVPYRTMFLDLKPLIDAIHGTNPSPKDDFGT